ncbi:MAG: DUF4199 domain-containing protein [Pseudomonadota bacterium]
MLRLALMFGGVAGGFVAAATVVKIALFGVQPDNMLAGYLIMVVGMSLIFLGVKHDRDRVQGGDIAFGRAMVLGLLIAGCGGLFYALLWDVYLAATDYVVIDAYVEMYLEKAREAGASSRELEALSVQQQEIIESYGNPLFRIAIAFSEVFPVGLLMALISAALLSNRNFLPGGSSRQAS